MMNQTMPVIVEDENMGYFSYAVLFQPQEASVFHTLFCKDEETADKHMHEYEHEGTITLPAFTPERKIVYTPIMALKTKVTRALRKEFRVVTLPNPDIIE